MKDERVVFFTIVDDRYYYPIGAHIFVNSFRRFHPDIDLVVFRQDMIDKVFAEKKINFYMAKPTFAKLLTSAFDLVVNIDADHIILARLDEVLAQDYDIGAPWNFNDYENTSVENVTEEMFVQGGMVASRDKKFWDIWEERNVDAMKYKCQENDILNLIWYNDPYVSGLNRKIFDKEKNYLGCKSLGKEGDFYVEGRKIMCLGGQVKAYHHAKGGAALPKLQFDEMGFSKEVAELMKVIGYYGKTERYGPI